MRKTASRTLIFALTGAAVTVGVLALQTVTAATATSIEYKAQQAFTVQPGEGWLEHTKYNQPQKNTTNSPMTVGPLAHDAFLCKGGECPQYLTYHYGDVVDMGTVQAGTQIRMQNYLHDNPGDGRRTRIMKGSQEVKVCEEGWVAPDCIYVVTDTANYKVKFEDSVAVEVVKVEPTPVPTASPTATPVPTTQPTAVPTQAPTVAPTAQPTNAPSSTLPPAPGGDGKSDGRTESLGCQNASDNCAPAQGGSVLGASTLPATGGWSDLNTIVLSVATLSSLAGVNLLALARMFEKDLRA